MYRHKNIQVRIEKTRSKIVEAMKEMTGYTSAEDLYIYLRTHDVAIGTSTVYNHLKQMVENGTVMVRAADRKMLYCLATV